MDEHEEAIFRCAYFASVRPGFVGRDGKWRTALGTLGKLGHFVNHIRRQVVYLILCPILLYCTVLDHLVHCVSINRSSVENVDFRRTRNSKIDPVAYLETCRVNNQDMNRALGLGKKSADSSGLVRKALSISYLPRFLPRYRFITATTVMGGR